MKLEWRARSKKVMFASLSAILLAGHIPYNVVAQETDDIEAEVSADTEIKESIDDVLKVTETVEISESFESEQEPEVELDNDKVKNVEPTSFERISEFIHNFDSLTTEEIDLHIETFKLFSDDASVLHSTLEEVDQEINQLNQKSFDGLITYLETIRKENLVKLENNPDLINKDLEEENVNVEESFNNLESFDSKRSLMTPSSSQTVQRLQGLDRYETAVSISKSGWKQAETVVIVDANGFADALAGAPLAKALNAPVLLAGSGTGNAKTIKEVERLGAKKAVILGGQSAVSTKIGNELKNRNITVERIAGVNRYDTAKLIANEIVKLTNSTRAILVSGEDFADAMSVAPFAASQGMPIYLTRKRTLSTEVKEASKQIKDWTIVGGGSAVSGAVGKDLQSRVTSIRRIEGKDRYETNRRVIKHFSPSTEKIYVATGLEFMDALTGSVLAAKQNTGVVLVRNNAAVLEDTVKFAEANSFFQLTIFGGIAALSERVEETLRNMKIPTPKPVIFIDTGHGGTDPGAQYGGYKEKNIVLTTTKMLKDLLVNSGDYEIIMSRETDKYLTLAQRSSMANQVQADISISVHVNAMGGKWAGLAKGIETFIYHPSYTTTRLVFDMDNYRIRESLRLADAVHNSLIANTGLSNRGVRGANLHMVREPKMPAILPELGFINNLDDLSVVTTYKFQKTAAESIKQGVDIYFAN